MIAISNLQKSFGKGETLQPVFCNLNLIIEKNQIITLLGPNGCGKTTLLNLISQLDQEYSGDITIKDEPKIRILQTSYMMQKDLLLPWLNVRENILLPLQIQKKVTKNALESLDWYLEVAGIQSLVLKYPSLLSGGERQKISLVRTLLIGAPIILLDEPFASIDYNSRIELQTLLYNHARQNNVTVVLVSHDIDEAIALSDRIVILDRKPNGIAFDINVTFQTENRTPITVRQEAKFSFYYRQLWNNYPR